MTVFTKRRTDDISLSEGQNSYPVDIQTAPNKQTVVRAKLMRTNLKVAVLILTLFLV